MSPIQLANKCLLMAAVCYNLKRLLKWTADGSRNTGKNLAKCFSTLWGILPFHSWKSHLAVAVSR
jgi:hypothetical protein